MNEFDKNKGDFESLVGKIQSTSSALQEDARLVINRNVTARAWLTGFYIVEYEQHGNDRAKYGEGLLKRLAERLDDKSMGLASLKNYRQFYLYYPDLARPIANYLQQKIQKSQAAFGLSELADNQQLEKSQAAFGFLLVQDSEKEGKSQTLPDLFLLHDYQMIAKSQALPDFSSLLLCTEYGQEMVEYVTPNIDPNVFVAQYELQLPSKEKIKEFLMKENKG